MTTKSVSERNLLCWRPLPGDCVHYCDVEVLAAVVLVLDKTLFDHLVPLHANLDPVVGSQVAVSLVQVILLCLGELSLFGSLTLACETSENIFSDLYQP